MIITRRSLIQATAIVAGQSGLPWPVFAAPLGAFTHSVASGDPQQRSVILWTRFVPGDGREAVVRVELADDERFTRIVARGEATASPATDWCAKCRPTGLQPGRWYYYRFVAPDGSLSPVGRTRTLPEGPLRHLRIAVVGCANATSGWFNAYAHAAARDDLDLVVHTGDYIYESAIDRPDAIAAIAAARHIEPHGVAVSLADYRLRYASYKADAGLMELHRRYPMIIMWDDHEIANNCWHGGAKSHRAADGPWAARVAGAMRAHHEWLPVGPADYDSYQFGDLATLYRLETRLLARSRQLDLTSVLSGGGDQRQAIVAFRDGPLADPARTMMGPVQERWLADGLAASTTSRTRWQVVAQQVVMAPMRLPPVTAAWFAPGVSPNLGEQVELAAAAALSALRVPLSLDRWDGYPAARGRLLASAAAACADLVVLSGDSHNAWSSDLVHDGKPVGVEFAGHSVSSLGLEKRFGGNPTVIADAFVAANPGLKWCDTARRGYMVIDVTPERVASEWLFIPSGDNPAVTVVGQHSMNVGRGARRIA